MKRLVLLFTAMGVAVTVCGAAAFAATVNGTAGDDILNGTVGADVISGRAGNDVVRGFAGSDVLHGEDGDDKLYGSSGPARYSQQEQLVPGAKHNQLDGIISRHLRRGGR